MEEENEYVYVIQRYLSIPDRVKAMNEYINQISDEYYATHSLIGTVSFDRDSNCYERAIPTAYAALDIYCKECLYLFIKRKLEKRYSLFSEGFENEELEQLKHKKWDAKLFEKAIFWINELDYYFSEHSINRKNNKESIELLDISIQELDALEDSIEELFGGLDIA